MIPNALTADAAFRVVAETRPTMRGVAPVGPAALDIAETSQGATDAPGSLAAAGFGTVRDDQGTFVAGLQGVHPCAVIRQSRCGMGRRIAQVDHHAPEARHAPGTDTPFDPMPIVDGPVARQMTPCFSAPRRTK